MLLAAAAAFPCLGVLDAAEAFFGAAFFFEATAAFRGGAFFLGAAFEAARLLVPLLVAPFTARERSELTFFYWRAS